jgi:hypothetical protein
VAAGIVAEIPEHSRLFDRVSSVHFARKEANRSKFVRILLARRRRRHLWCKTGRLFAWVFLWNIQLLPQEERDNRGITPEVTPAFTQASRFFPFCYAGKYQVRSSPASHEPRIIR